MTAGAADRIQPAACAFHRQKREWKRQWRMAAPPPLWPAPQVPEHVGYGTQMLRGVFVPMFGIVNAALTIGLLIAIISILDTGNVRGVALPAGVPPWAGILILVAIYQIVLALFRMIRYGLYRSPYGIPGRRCGAEWSVIFCSSSRSCGERPSYSHCENDTHSCLAVPSRICSG